MHGFVNLDMVAYNPDRNRIVALTNVPSRWLADAFVAAASGVGDFTAVRTVQGLTFSDHGPFWARGREAILLIEEPDVVAHNPHYHRDTDTFANTFSRGGEQVAKTAEALVNLVETWRGSGSASALTMTAEDIRITRGIAVDAAEVGVGDSTEIAVGVTNRGGPAASGWSLAVELRIDGRPVRTFAPVEGPALPPGGRASFRLPWIPTEGERAAVTVAAAVIDAPGDVSPSPAAERYVSVSSDAADILRAYVYPNPTTDPRSAILHYELSREGPLRFRLLDVTGRIVDTATLSYDPAFPDPDVDVGVAERPLGVLFSVDDLAPGLYLIRLEQLDPGTLATAAVRVIKVAVIR
jgi:hypothetical protein